MLSLESLPGNEQTLHSGGFSLRKFQKIQPSMELTKVVRFLEITII